MIPIPTDLRELERKPVEYIEQVGDIYFRGICLENKGDIVPQHTHDYSHATLVATGGARVWVDGKYLGDFKAPAALLIEAKKEHVFQAMEPMTRLYCVHSLNGEPYRFLKETTLEKR